MNENISNYGSLKELVLNEGITLFGVADIVDKKKGIDIPKHVLDKFDFAVSIGFRLSRAIIDTIDDGPNKTYYFHYQRANILLDQAILKITSYIQNKGCDAFPVAASQVIDWQKQAGVLSHREFARLAGHGWYGKNNLLVNPDFGSQARYATVLTNLPLKTDPEIKGGCGNCSLCIKACPANAISENSFNLELCTAKLKEFMKTRGIGQMICGVCIKACKGKHK